MAATVATCQQPTAGTCRHGVPFCTIGISSAADVEQLPVPDYRLAGDTAAHRLHHNTTPGRVRIVRQ